MEPINTQERNTALVKFIGIFVVTMLVVLMAAFFGMIIPTKENKSLKKENTQLGDQLRAQDQILAKMDSLELWMIELGRPGADINMTDIRISRMLAEMQAYENDSTTLGKIMKNVNVAYASLKNEKMNMHSTVGSSDEEIKKLKEDMEELEEDLKDCEKAKVDMMMKMGS